MSPVRVLLVDDQALFREGLRAVLGAHPELLVVGEAENGEKALLACERLGPDVVLMDMKMPVLDGVSATRRLSITHPRIRVAAHHDSLQLR